MRREPIVTGVIVGVFIAVLMVYLPRQAKPVCTGPVDLLFSDCVKQP